LVDGIGTCLRIADPAFSARLTIGNAQRCRRRHIGLAHGYLWLGMFLSLTGFGFVHEALGVGAILILSGAGVLLLALVRLLQLRLPDSGLRRRRLP